MTGLSYSFICRNDRNLPVIRTRSIVSALKLSLVPHIYLSGEINIYIFSFYNMLFNSDNLEITIICNYLARN